MVGEYKTALSGELDYAGKDGPGGVLERDPAKAKKLNVGNAILELWNPPETEGAAYVIEGLTFDREASGQGVGIKVPAETVPKNITFRDIKVYHQNVGVHINYCWQIRFESCIIRGNQTGVWGT